MLFIDLTSSKETNKLIGIKFPKIKVQFPNYLRKI